MEYLRNLVKKGGTFSIFHFGEDEKEYETGF